MSEQEQLQCIVCWAKLTIVQRRRLLWKAGQGRKEICNVTFPGIEAFPAAAVKILLAAPVWELIKPGGLRSIGIEEF